MVDTVTIALVAMAAIVATIFGIKKDAKNGTKSKPPPNKAAEVAREVAQKEFDDNIKALTKAVQGDSAADDLARLGNERKR